MEYENEVFDANWKEYRDAFLALLAHLLPKKSIPIQTHHNNGLRLMTTQTSAEESLQRLLEEEPCSVNVMMKSERFGLACGWLACDGHTLSAENYQLARDFADYWGDHEVPQSLIRAKLTETLLLRRDFGTEEDY